MMKLSNPKLQVYNLRLMAQSMRKEISQIAATENGLGGIHSSSHRLTNIVGKSYAQSMVDTTVRWFDVPKKWAYSVHLYDETFSGKPFERTVLSVFRDRAEDLSEDDLHNALLETAKVVQGRFEQKLQSYGGRMPF